MTHHRKNHLPDDATVMLSPGQPKDDKNPDTWQIGDIIGNRYKLNEVFSGAMGHVYIADHLQWGVPMAIKVPRPEIMQSKEGINRILTEANGWIKLSLHPNIAACYFVRKQQKAVQIFIEYVNGGTLLDWIQKKRLNNLRDALTIAIQCCNGFEYTHSKNIIHRDIKPQNILLSREGLVKITDFGIVRYLEETRPQHKSTGRISADTTNDATIGFRGTPNYASPEQLRNTHTVDKRTDIYSFGLCLWMLFCGKRPYKNNTMTECPEPESSIPHKPLTKSLQTILKKCVQHNPDDRYNSFTEIRNDLHSIFIDHFKVSCPYATMGPVKLQAEHLNNRAVSLAELGKMQEARNYLHKALELNDNLPEAVANLHLLTWRCTKLPAPLLERRTRAALQRFPDFAPLQKLNTETKNSNRSSRHCHPELTLCTPATPMELFQTNQLQESIRTNIKSLAKSKQYQQCFTSLKKFWQQKGFGHDLYIEKIYTSLSQLGQPRKLLGVQRKKLVRLKDPVNFLQFNKQTSRIIAASASGHFFTGILPKNWYIGQQQKPFLQDQATFRLHTSPITALDICPSGSYIAIGLKNGEIILRALATGKQKTIHTEGDAITSMLFSQNNRWLVTSFQSGKVLFLDLKNNNSYPFTTPFKVKTIISLQDGLRFALGTNFGSIQIWDFKQKKMDYEIDGHVLPVQNLALAGDGKQFISSSEDRMLRIWDLNQRNCVQTIEDNDDIVNTIFMSDDLFSLVTGCHSDLIKIWDYTDGSLLHIIDGRGDGILALTQGLSQFSFLSGNKNGTVVLWKPIYDLQFNT
jgi:serine/threonine protein kinase